jgi:8-oxo-dGTP diphosphatase
MHRQTDPQLEPLVPASAVHVAVAVVRDGQGRVLIARRPGHVHQGGLWEFPGGKVEAAETVLEALRRELLEELGITVIVARPLICIAHAYADKRVFLDVWAVQSWSGDVAGREGQPIRWVDAGKLRHYPFPAANLPIIQAVALPILYAITPEPDPGDPAPWLAKIDRAVTAGLRLLQVRAVTLPAADYRRTAAKVIAICHARGCRVLLNAEPSLAVELGADGVHLNGARLRHSDRRPLPPGYLVAASCHDAAQLEQAATIGADFAVLGPVETTASHPGAPGLGWQAFHALATAATLPVFALGGMQPAHISTAWRAGAQGLAMITGLWAAADPAGIVAELSG